MKDSEQFSVLCDNHHMWYFSSYRMMGRFLLHLNLGLMFLDYFPLDEFSLLHFILFNYMLFVIIFFHLILFLIISYFVRFQNSYLLFNEHLFVLSCLLVFFSFFTRDMVLDSSYVFVSSLNYWCPYIPGVIA